MNQANRDCSYHRKQCSAVQSPRYEDAPQPETRPKNGSEEAMVTSTTDVEANVAASSTNPPEYSELDQMVSQNNDVLFLRSQLFFSQSAKLFLFCLLM